MKKLIFSVILALAALFGVFRIQSEQAPIHGPSAQEEQHTPAVKIKAKKCFALASRKFVHGKSELYRFCVDFFDEICGTYNFYENIPRREGNNGNRKLLLLLWRALIDKQGEALEIVLDMVQHAQKVLGTELPHDEPAVNRMVSCLKDVGEERCLLGLVVKPLAAGAVGGTAVGVVDRFRNKNKRDALIKSWEAYDALKKEREAMRQQLLTVLSAHPEEQHNDIEMQLNRKWTDFKQSIFHKQVEAEENLIKELYTDGFHVSPIMPLESEVNRKLAMLDLAETIKPGNRVMAVAAVAAGVVALEGFHHAYKTRQERKRWGRFKKDREYKTVLADALNKFIEDMLPKLDRVNALIKTLYSQSVFGSNRLSHASLRWMVEHLNTGALSVSFQKMQQRFTKLLFALNQGYPLTMNDLKEIGIDPSSRWGSGRWKEDYSFDVYMKPPSQAEIVKFLWSDQGIEMMALIDII